MCDVWKSRSDLNDREGDQYSDVLLTLKYYLLCQLILVIRMLCICVLIAKYFYDKKWKLGL